ncbi:hypothetical protein CON65_15905 [Bacillus pseudomycoides]|uniref:Phage protein n=1 Tax=Bacillus pseudomycoides TaxID=64104 RepID=A0AA91ZSF2_9BACI|nr:MULTISPECIES: hypothetical protein [Bacillus]PEB56240.1 hypothetical protein COO03_01340 [Bacillus sp. AFS098217]PED81670.1 hypothetical protein CON65_15905 [Bacillus pseudomycoides]
MITYKDIKKAINSLLTKEFAIDINSNDVKEGFARPSFFVQFENSNRSGNESQVYKSLTVQIYYFPSDRHNYSIEVMEVQEQLENLFDLKLKVLDRFFNIDNTSATTTDGVLSFSFDIAFYEGREFEYNTTGVDYPVEPMEELDFEKAKE